MNRRTKIFAALLASAAGLVLIRRAIATADPARLDAAALEGLARLETLASAGFASMAAAMAKAGPDEDHDAVDARAAADFERLSEFFATAGDAFPPGASALGKALLDIFETARVQVMTFAINRKNRGGSDAGRAKMEDADRKAFVRDAGEKIASLQQAIKAKRLAA